MLTTEQMLLTVARKSRPATDALAGLIDACLACDVACSACAGACLAEGQLAKLRRCVRLNLDCAELCGATARLLARYSEPEEEVLRAALAACEQACKACAAECEKHDMDHCRACARACRHCEAQCGGATGELSYVLA